MHLGLIAGNGRFPFLVLEAARAAGHDVTVIAAKEETFPELNDAAKRTGSEIHWVSLGQLGTCIALLKSAGVTHAVMAGQVKHAKIFSSGITPDWTLAKVLASSSAHGRDYRRRGGCSSRERHGDGPTALIPWRCRADHEPPWKKSRRKYRMATRLPRDIGQTRGVAPGGRRRRSDGYSTVRDYRAGLAGPAFVSSCETGHALLTPVIGFATIQRRVAGARPVGDAGKTLCRSRQARIGQ
jgi:hypothetical protein